MATLTEEIGQDMGKGWVWSSPNIGKYSTALSVAVGLLIFCYFVIFATAYPSPELLRAIAFEVVIFIVVLWFKLRQGRSKAARLENMVMDELGSQWKTLNFLRKAGSALVLACWFAVTAFLVVDLSALTSAWLGNYSLARNIYMAQYNLARVPYAALIGSPANTAIPVVHPAYSLEILTGAYIEAGKHDLARQLTKELMEMRQQLFGVNSELYAGVLANSANLYRKEGNLAKAEEISKEALLISRGVLKNTGMGQIITQVADNLRDQGKYSEAEPLYVEALQMREKQFGPGSVKAAETLVEYAKLLRARGQLALADDAKARRYEERSAEIFKRHETKNDPIASMLVTALFFLVSIVVSKILFGPRGYLTKVAMRRLERNLNTVSESASAATVTEAGVAAKHNASNSRENIGKLIKFYENQNNIEQVEKYRNMLAGIGKD